MNPIARLKHFVVLHRDRKQMLVAAQLAAKEKRRQARRRTFRRFAAGTAFASAALLSGLYSCSQAHKDGYPVNNIEPLAFRETGAGGCYWEQIAASPKHRAYRRRSPGCHGALPK